MAFHIGMYSARWQCYSQIIKNVNRPIVFRGEWLGRMQNTIMINILQRKRRDKIPSESLGSSLL